MANDSERGATVRVSIYAHVSFTDCTLACFSVLFSGMEVSDDLWPANIKLVLDNK